MKAVGRVAPPIHMMVGKSTVMASANLRVSVARASISDVAKILKTRVCDGSFYEEPEG
jgi:hypothetical protein